MKNSLLIIGLVLIGTLYGCDKNNNSNTAGTSTMKMGMNTAEAKLQTVGVVNPVERSFNSEVSITATAMPFQMAKVHAMESGYIRSITKNIGDRVNKGGLIASLENPELTSKLKEGEAKVKQADAAILKHQAEKRKWEAQSNSKKIIFDRLNSAYKSSPNLVLVSDVDNAKAEYDMAAANIAVADAMVGAAQGERDAAVAVADAVRTRVSMLQVTAPFSGTITKRLLDNGATVQSGLSSSGSAPIVEMQDISKIRLTVNVPESDAGSISKGSEVKISFPELAGGDMTAKVSRTSGTLDPSSKTMLLEIDLPNKDGKIKPGMYAKVLLDAKTRAGILSVPVAAKKLIDDMPYILVVENDMVKAVPLKKGLENRDYIELLNNVTTSTQIIVQGKNLVKDGQKVKASLLKK